ncbi:MAG: deoxyguanosinetriphosphate triphosphohydrolase, partial [Clostridia bacterium]|nr:deoxyguanosinetriphosphate triphosphohydrolase [Clostridia bacterium]
KVEMEADIYESTMSLRQFLFDNVYFNPVAKSEESKACDMIDRMYDYFCKNSEKIPFEYRKNLDYNTSLERTVCDYLGCMTDRFAVQTFENLFVPKKWAIL